MRARETPRRMRTDTNAVCTKATDGAESPKALVLSLADGRWVREHLNVFITGHRAQMVEPELFAWPGPN